MDIAKQIDLARQFVAERPSDEVMREVSPHRAGELLIAIWTYQIKGNDRADFYNAMIKHQGAMSKRFMGDNALHFACQSPSSAVDMFERCKSMCKWLLNATEPVVFLDNDAFPNADLRPVFDQIEHVGLTVRHEPGLMPVNEGVIFARPTDEARRFFLSYLATYERLREVMKPDDWRWWGGQLALNAVAAEQVWRLQNGIEAIEDCLITRLPCSTYNYSPDGPQTRETLDGKLVLHLKGPRKALFDQLVKYQEERA